MTEETLLPDQPQPINPDDYIGEGKKWKDQATLIKAKQDSDSYIRIMEARLDDFRNENTELLARESTRAKLEDLLGQADERLASRQITPPPKEETTMNTPTKPEDIRNLAREEFANLRRQDQEQSNFNTVRTKLIERFGDNYAPAVREHIADLGMSDTEFNEMARRNPKVLMNALGLNETKRETFQAPPPSSGALRGKPPVKRTWTYYQELKKANPGLYRDPKIAKEMHDSAMELGNDFYDGDFGEYRDVRGL